MRQRSTKILQMMIDRDDRTYSLDGLAKSLGVTKKTLRSDLSLINDFLGEIGLSGITLSYEGVLQTEEDFDTELIGRKLSEMDLYRYKLSPEERRVYILAVLLRDRDYTIMQKLADEMYVTRITILGDFDLLKEWLSELGIELRSDSGKGVKLDCTQGQRTRILLEIFEQISTGTRNIGYFQRFVLGKLNLRFSFQEILSLLEQYMQEQNMVLSDETCYIAATYLYAAFNAAVFGDEENREESLPFNGSVFPGDLNVLGNAMHFMGEKLGVPLTKEMVENYAVFRRRKGLQPQVRTVDDIELYHVIAHFLSAIDREQRLSLSEDPLLIEALLQHIRNLKDWGNDEKIELPESETADIDYEQLQEAVERHKGILEKYLTYPISANMRTSIVIHICVSILRCGAPGDKIAVAIVCPGSMATGRYLEVQVRNYFDFRIVGVIAAGSLQRRLSRIGHVDFILSTVGIETDRCPVLRVHPLLQMEDLNRIQKIAFSLGQGRKDEKALYREDYLVVEQVRTLIEQGRFTEEMHARLTEALALYEQMRGNKISELGKILRVENILIHNGTGTSGFSFSTDLDWRTAIRAAGEILLREGCITEEYIEQSIQNIEEYGDYIIMGEGVAVAHASRECGVLSQGISLLVSEPGILFSDGETRVQFLFFFASGKEKGSPNLIREIASLGRDPERRQMLAGLSAEEIQRELSEAQR